MLITKCKKYSQISLSVVQLLHACTYISHKLRLIKFYISNLYQMREKFYIITSKVNMNLFV